MRTTLRHTCGSCAVLKEGGRSPLSISFRPCTTHSKAGTHRTATVERRLGPAPPLLPASARSSFHWGGKSLQGVGGPLTASSVPCDGPTRNNSANQPQKLNSWQFALCALPNPSPLLVPLLSEQLVGLRDDGCSVLAEVVKIFATDEHVDNRVGNLGKYR